MKTLLVIVSVILLAFTTSCQPIPSAILLVDETIMDDFPYTANDIISAPFYVGSLCSMGYYTGSWCLNIEVICINYRRYYPNELEFTLKIPIADTLLIIDRHQWYPVRIIQGKRVDIALVRITPSKNISILTNSDHVHLEWISNISRRRPLERQVAIEQLF